MSGTKMLQMARVSANDFKGKADGERFNGTGTLSGSRTQGRYDWNAERAGQTGAIQ